MRVPTQANPHSLTSKVNLKSSQFYDWLLFFILFITFGYFYQGGFANLNSRFDLTLSLAFEKIFSIDTFHQNTIDKIFYNGHYYSEKAPGTAYLALPIPMIASKFLSTSELIQSPWKSDLLLYLSTLFSVSTLSAAAAVCFRRFLCVLNPKRTLGESIQITLALFTGTLILPYSTILFSHQIAGSLLIMGAYFGYTAAKESHPLPLRKAGSAFLLGLAVFVEYPSALLAIAIAFGLWKTTDKKWDLICFLPFAMIPGIALLVHNSLSFGDPWSLGYGKLQGTQFATQMGQGFFGVSLPSFSRAIQLLFGRYRGLFFYSPVLVIALFSVWSSRKQENIQFYYTLLLGCAATLLLNSSYGYWQGGVCFGPRHLVPIIPALALGLAYIPTHWIKHPVSIAVAFLSLAINFIGTVTTPFVSEYDTNPMFQSYWQLIKQGAISANPVSFLSPQSEIGYRWKFLQEFPNASLNLGELMGLSGWSSLLPLLFFWILFLLRVRALNRNQRV